MGGPDIIFSTSGPGLSIFAGPGRRNSDEGRAADGGTRPFGLPNAAVQRRNFLSFSASAGSSVASLL
jgi:hypothetical protein